MGMAAGLPILGPHSAEGAEAEPATPASPRDLYNEGTRQLREGKLTEAEASLQSAVAGQNEKVQPPALYNLGEVRFIEGARELKKGPSSRASAARSDRASEAGGNAIRAVDDALGGADLQAMVAAYRQGRGARKELKAAVAAVKAALESYGSVLTKWTRASGDFKSAHELLPSDADALSNAAVVDRHIAELVDLKRMMMQSMSQMGKQQSELRQKMGQLKKRMPPEMGQESKGNGDDDDDDEDKPPQEPKPGQEEGPSKDGGRQLLTPEEAARLLGMLKLDTNRKLPYGMENTAKPKDRKGRDW